LQRSNSSAPDALESERSGARTLAGSISGLANAILDGFVACHGSPLTGMTDGISAEVVTKGTGIGTADGPIAGRCCRDLDFRRLAKSRIATRP
jgi:hypothetical protein